MKIDIEKFLREVTYIKDFPLIVKALYDSEIKTVQGTPFSPQIPTFPQGTYI